MLFKEAGFSDAAVARTFTSGTPRILFFDTFFKNKPNTRGRIRSDEAFCFTSLRFYVIHLLPSGISSASEKNL